VVEALADMCRRHVSLLDGLADTYRDELERVLAGGDVEWTGRGGHQRLFVAAAELTRLAAGSTGLLLTIDDLHEADEASMRLLHYLARSTADSRVVLVVSHRPSSAPALVEMRASLLERHGAIEVDLAPLDGDAVRKIVVATLGREPTDDVTERIAALSGGVPFAVIELARRAAQEPEWARYVDVDMVTGIDPALREVLQRVAVVGINFDTDEFVAMSGLDEGAAY
jgi:hypothetical protein